MRLNQHGFMMPLALVCSTLVILLCLHMMLLFNEDQAILTERYEGIEGDTLLFNGMEAVVSDHPHPSKNISGQYTFGEGTVSFQEKPVTATDVEIIINAVQKTNAKRHADIHFNPEKGVITSWMD